MGAVVPAEAPTARTGTRGSAQPRCALCRRSGVVGAVPSAARRPLEGVRAGARQGACRHGGHDGPRKRASKSETARQGAVPSTSPQGAEAGARSRAPGGAPWGRFPWGRPADSPPARRLEEFLLLMAAAPVVCSHVPHSHVPYGHVPYGHVPYSHVPYSHVPSHAPGLEPLRRGLQSRPAITSHIVTSNIVTSYIVSHVTHQSRPTSVTSHAVTSHAVTSHPVSPPLARCSCVASHIFTWRPISPTQAISVGAQYRQLRRYRRPTISPYRQLVGRCGAPTDVAPGAAARREGGGGGAPTEASAVCRAAPRA